MKQKEGEKDQMNLYYQAYLCSTLHTALSYLSKMASGINIEFKSDMDVFIWVTLVTEEKCCCSWFSSVY